MALALPLIDSCTSSTDKALEQPLLFSHLADKRSIAEVGAAYRKSFPAEDNKMRLKQLLLGDNTSTDKSIIQNLLDKHVVQDFKNGSTTVIKGWVLSVTEARQCALYAILNS